MKPTEAAAPAPAAPAPARQTLSAETVAEILGKWPLAIGGDLKGKVYPGTLYVSFAELSASGKHTKITLGEENAPDSPNRIQILEDPADLKLWQDQTGARFTNPSLCYAVSRENAESPWYDLAPSGSPNAFKGDLVYHTCYMTNPGTVEPKRETIAAGSNALRGAIAAREAAKAALAKAA